MDEDTPAIGIDLGTTFSCAAVLQNDQIKIIHGDDGNRIMASCVLFKNTGERIVGNSAKEQGIMKFNNCVLGVKRLIGRKYEECMLAENSILYPFQIKNQNDKPIIVVNQENKEKCFAPEEISAMILTKLKERAEEVLRKKITKAVITVPAHFNGSQREATKQAGQIAGLNVLRILNEPTAAALAYELDNKYNEKGCNVLVYDFGGGTFDVSIVNIFQHSLNVKATNGEPFLGGDNIDRNITEYLIKEFHRKTDKDINSDSAAARRILSQVEKSKIKLSTEFSVDVEVDYIMKDTNFSMQLTRARLDQLNKDLFEKSLECVKQTLTDANMTKDDIDEIVLIGGTTRIPYIRQMVKSYFNKDPNASIHPDEAVAIGAARQAALSQKINSELIRSLKLSDVCSLSLGVECQGQIMYVIIPRNQKIPHTKVQSFPLQKGETSVRITVFEGERSLVSDNIKLGEIILKDLQEKSQNVVINVTFSINEEGILHVVAEEQDGHQRNEIKVDMTKNQLSPEDIAKMIAKAKVYKKEDKKRKEITAARIDLETYCYDIQKAIIDKEDISDDINVEIINKCNDAVNWLSDNVNLTLDQLYVKKGELYEFCQPYLEDI